MTTSGKQAPAKADGAEDESQERTDLDTAEDVSGDTQDDAERDAAAARAAKEAGGGDADDENPLDAFRKAMADAADPEKHQEQQTHVDAAKGKEQTGKDGDKPADKEPGAKDADGKDKPDAAKPDKPEAKTPEELKKEAEDAAAKHRQDTDKEADALNLKGKQRERFHSMSDRIRENGAQIEAHEKTIRELAGVAGLTIGKEAKFEDVVKGIASSVKAGREFEDAIFASGLTGEDFQTASVLKRCMESADPNLLNHARGHLVKMIESIDTRMGHRVEGGDDALLAPFKDLTDKIAAGALDKADAIEIAKYRNQGAALGKAQQQIAEQNNHATLMQQAGQQCVAFAERASTADPVRWRTLWPQTEKILADIRKDVPPAQWADQFELRYSRLQYTPPARQPEQGNANGAGNAGVPRPGGAQPRRGGGGRPDGAHTSDVQPVVDEEADPFKAFQAAMRGAATT